MARKRKQDTPQTTPQHLASIIDYCRKKMRVDKGLSGELDRLPMLTWIMFLKFMDDTEDIRKTASELNGKRFKPAIEHPYRWRDWAMDEGFTGPDLIAFINQDEARGPDGQSGPGLFKYLRSLQALEDGDRRDVISRVFIGIINRMTNGYLLREVVNKINEIHFNSTEEIHTLSHLYESMLKEMRDAAGDSGEFYTPRPVIKFIVKVIDPQLGETILDPAAGTGGFLVESFEHLKQQCRTTTDYKILHRQTLHGGEAKPLPYMLCEMNLLLHGHEFPNIDPGNSLRYPLREIGDKERVNVIMTNPPFGGEEEKGILGNFPEDKRTSETALLFLQLIMRKLKRPKAGKSGGRCAMVVPDGTLSATEVAARIKKELLEQFNLHTIVRLPKGVFAPYSDIPTNLLFFQRNGPTKEIWFYEIPLPLGRKSYVKTIPMKYDEFEPVLEWWNKREKNEYAWKVKPEDIAGNSYNLDVKNPNSSKNKDYRSPEKIVESIIDKEKRIMELLEDIKGKIETD